MRMTSLEIDPPTYKLPESVLVVIFSPAFDVLMLERADRPGFWQSVTGSRASAEETLIDTAVREVREETGIVVERRTPPEPDLPAVVPFAQLADWHHDVRYEIYAHWRRRYAPDVTHNVEHWFGLCVPRNIPIRLEPREHLRFEWLDWTLAAQRCFSPSNRDAILELPSRCSEPRISAKDSTRR